MLSRIDHMCSLSVLQWAKKATTSARSASGSKAKSSTKTSGNLIVLSDDDEDDDYDEISLAAAPCPYCHKTFSFDADVYEEHVTTCTQKATEVLQQISESCISYVAGKHTKDMLHSLGPQNRNPSTFHWRPHKTTLSTWRTETSLQRAGPHCPSRVRPSPTDYRSDANAMRRETN